MYHESSIRSVIKTISWRVWATLTTVVLVLLFTKKIDIALTVGIIEVFLKMIFYYLHERIWDRIDYGRIKEDNVLSHE